MFSAAAVVADDDGALLGAEGMSPPSLASAASVDDDDVLFGAEGMSPPPLPFDDDDELS